MKSYIFLFSIIIFVLSIFLSLNFSVENLNSKFTWPTENYHTITSYFGYRIHPTTFKSSYHSGIDIGAPEGSNILSISNGIVSFIGFNGAYGYSIIIQNNNLEILYGHVSPNFIISKRRYYFTRKFYWKYRTQIYFTNT